MISDSGCDFRDEDKQLKVGKPVKAYWNRDGFYYQGEGIITQLQRDNVTVQLQKKVAWSDDFKAGGSICLPRICDSRRWNSRNCVRPLKNSTKKH